VSGKPFLTTERLELWQPRKEDRMEVHRLMTTGKTARFLGPLADEAEFFKRFLRAAGSWHLYGYGMFLVRPHGRREIVGNCGIFHNFRGLGGDFDDQPEAGWILRHDCLGLGYGSEVMRAALGWFERAHGCQRIVCMIAPENASSLKLAAKLGFTPLRAAKLPDGESVRLLERIPANGGRPAPAGQGTAGYRSSSPPSAARSRPSPE
jgi:RimJ/RimL family protein N-acetyltransferase